MTTKLLSLVGGCIFLAVNVQAQNHFKLVFRGTCVQTNGAGKAVTKNITEATWLKDFARENALPSTKNLGISYHLNADEKGDQIEVINKKTGEVYGNVFGLFFSEAFGRTGLTNSTGTQTKTLQYLYTGQDSHSLGAAVVTKTLSSAKLKHPKMEGQMQYELLPTETRKSVKICSGNFVTGARYVFKTSSP